jgi:hypothetical protein
MPSGRLGFTFASNQAAPSSSDSHISMTRQPPAGLGPPACEMKPLAYCRLGFRPSSIPA